MRDGKSWLTVREVAEILEVNPQTVRRWIKSGHLVAAMLGGTKAGYRIQRSELGAFVRRGEERARLGSAALAVAPDDLTGGGQAG